MKNPDFEYTAPCGCRVVLYGAYEYRESMLTSCREHVGFSPEVMAARCEVGAAALRALSESRDFFVAED